MIRFGEGLKDSLQRSPLFLAYVILVLLIVIGFLYVEALTRKVDEQSEARARIQCLAGNDTRQVISNLLDALSVQRDGDEPGEFEARMETRRRLDPLLLPKNCDEVLEGRDAVEDKVDLPEGTS